MINSSETIFAECETLYHLDERRSKFYGKRVYRIEFPFIDEETSRRIPKGTVWIDEDELVEILELNDDLDALDQLRGEGDGSEEG